MWIISSHGVDHGAGEDVSSGSPDLRKEVRTRRGTQLDPLGSDNRTRRSRERAFALGVKGISGWFEHGSFEDGHLLAQLYDDTFAFAIEDLILWARWHRQ